MTQDRRATIWGAILLVVVLAFFLWQFPFSKQIEQTIPATIYADGAAIDTTTVYINGTKTNYLFQKKNRFNGTFAIACLEKTKDSSAGIYWYEQTDKNRLPPQCFISYVRSGISQQTEIETIVISDNMQQFVIHLADGRRIATSEAMAQTYPWR